MKRVEEDCAMFRLMPKTKKSEVITYDILLDHNFKPHLIGENPHWERTNTVKF